MKLSLQILNELKAISPLIAALEKVNVFSVPERYFINLSNQILERINTQPHFVIATSENHTLKVPEGYFENLADNILHKIKNIEAKDSGDELKQLSPVLYAVQKENVLKVPENYFKNLPGDILIKAKLKQQPKVVVMKKRSSVWNYAAAAILTGIIAISALWISNKSSQQSVGMQVTETALIPVNYFQEVHQYKNEKQINEGISKLSAEDIIKYLETTGSDADNADLVTNLNEKELPAQQDYLLDEKTLDKYIKQSDLKSSEN